MARGHLYLINSVEKKNHLLTVAKSNSSNPVSSIPRGILALSWALLKSRNGYPLCQTRHLVSSLYQRVRRLRAPEFIKGINLTRRTRWQNDRYSVMDLQGEYPLRKVNNDNCVRSLIFLFTKKLNYLRLSGRLSRTHYVKFKVACEVGSLESWLIFGRNAFDTKYIIGISELRFTALKCFNEKYSKCYNIVARVKAASP